MNRSTITSAVTVILIAGAGISVDNILNTNSQTHQVVDATTQQEFLNKAIPAATKASSKYGTYTSVMLAQAILESNWGNSQLAQEPNNNLFGIKGSYQGNSVSFSTSEFSDDNGYYTVDANFRKYPTYHESFDDNGNLLRNGLNGYYSDTWIENAQSSSDATNGLQGKYATAPDYAQSLNKIISQYDLTKYDPKITGVNERKVIQKTCFVTSAPVESSVGKLVKTLHRGDVVDVTKYIAYGNGVKYALTNYGWIDAIAIVPIVSQAPVARMSDASVVNKIVKINYIPKYGIAVWQKPAHHVVGKYLAHGTSWRVDRQISINNHLWYRVGTNQWIDSQYTIVTYDSKKVAEPKTQAPASPVSSAGRNEVAAHGIVTVSCGNYQKLAVVNAPAGKLTGKKLANNTRWRFFKIAKADGHFWYNLGGNQWVIADYVYEK